jgi:uncharacterized membrane protein YedE/YeeE
MNSYVNVGVLRDAFVVALIAGVSITVLFSVAVRALAPQDESARPAAGQRMIAAGCLLVVVAGVAVGLWAVLAK